MALLADLAQRPKTAPRNMCPVCWLMEELPEEEAANLTAAMANEAVTYDEITAALAEMGYNVGRDSASRHARGQCAARVTLRKLRG